MSKIAMLGAGSWGTAVAMMLAQNGHDVTLWSNTPAKAERMQKERVNPLLPGVKFPERLTVTSDLCCVTGAKIVILATPSTAIRATAARLKSYWDQEQVLVNISKGLEVSSLKRLSEVIADELAPQNFAVLCGPSHAEEVSRRIPTTVVVSSTQQRIAELIQDEFMNPRFRIYTSHDIVGVELGAALKNVIAICAGIADGMGFGDNTKAALMTRGISEIARLGVALGGRQDTFAGLSGIGDLIVTCTSMHSRNRRAGILIGQGKSVDEALREVNMVVEGYVTAKAAYLLAQKQGVEMPIINEAYRVLYEGKDHEQAIYDLMTRSKKHESEEVWVKE